MSLFSDLEDIPNDPGVYLVKDKDEKVIYVGKAKNLKNRVKQHFQTTSVSKEDKLQELAHRVEWVLVRNESEALILERKLIRQLSPKLNSMLKDDKSNLLIRITMEQQFPQILVVRETDPRVGKSVYFGPFPNNAMLRQTVKLVLKIFPICDCGKNFERIREKGTTVRCMRARLGRCLAPWKNDITPEEYRKTAKNVISFLRGDVAKLLDTLEEEMWTASKDSNYEKAASIRDLTHAVRTILNIQEDLKSHRKNIDVLAFSEFENDIAFCKLEIREYRIHNIMNEVFPKEDGKLKDLGEVITFIYGQEKCKFPILIEEIFTNRFENNTNLSLKNPTNKVSEQLCKVAEKNAINELRRYKRDIQYKKESENVLEEMQKQLQLPDLPKIIHGYDISTLGGAHSVGSCVVFQDGKPQKKLYRRFRIRKEYSEPNDYAMMEEVVTRRYRSETLKNDPQPQLIIIDGGKGQLNIAIKVLEKLKIEVPIISIAKKKEEIYTEWSEESLDIEKNSSVQRLVQYVRDESHRFAINYHKNLRSKSVKDSAFEKIKGIGKAKVSKLFQEYKNLAEISKVSKEEIMKKLGVNEEIAKQILTMTHKILNKSPYDD
ncbi:MAG: excinuclease ABC subunit UvrC [Candidatus Heimdallarchaeaceae archaeon]